MSFIIEKDSPMTDSSQADRSKADQKAIDAVIMVQKELIQALDRRKERKRDLEEWIEKWNRGQELLAKDFAESGSLQNKEQAFDDFRLVFMLELLKWNRKRQ